LVKTADVEAAEQNFGPVIKINPQAGKEEYITQNNRCFERDDHNGNLAIITTRSRFI